MNLKRTLISFFLALLLASCSEKHSDSNTTTAATAPIATDAWLGQWNGPEGTFIRLSTTDKPGSNDRYEITIQNLDGPITYTGHHVDGKIRFERNGVVETIQHSNGEQTGMKWLVDKQDCLTVHPGEGYCRD